MKNKLLVNDRLTGFQVRYNGSEKAQLAATLSRWQQAGRLVIHCPELAAGLPTPRLPAEILGGTGGDVLAGRARIAANGSRAQDGNYQLAAWRAAATAWEAGCQAALLTDGSPTCGSQFVYDGSFRGRRKAGAGVAGNLPGIRRLAVFSDGQIPQLLAWMAQKEQDDDSV
ncbi:2-thiouracil desulfurase family protein [Klebsiella pneumoniae]|uniref:DUF523 domain-containing protein n=1 Tax=Klebsiella pneumoniae TaxID=573 RepID=UPI003987402F